MHMKYMKYSNCKYTMGLKLIVVRRESVVVELFKSCFNLELS